ncbi:unnamed protein product [Durusdinium trenchii]|uniref:Uncharacterized protein n=1 Tax=Durusdinium trenchii TaxID=1381693 RepID=A0ABP0N783_9DINO
MLFNALCLYIRICWKTSSSNIPQCERDGLRLKTCMYVFPRRWSFAIPFGKNMFFLACAWKGWSLNVSATDIADGSDCFEFAGNAFTISGVATDSLKDGKS